MSKSIIAIDGTAASGKSTVAAMLSEKLNYLYLDTGVMYRAVTWATFDRDIDLHDEQLVSMLAERLKIEIQSSTINDGRQATILVDGQDITWKIRSSQVEKDVSLVSSYPGVRTALTTQQRYLAQQGSIVMVGRDIGTVVLPQADLKIFMQASPEERAHRRHQELIAQGNITDYGTILTAIIERDKQDREKPISPLIPADDAHIINTDGLTIDEVMAEIQVLVETLIC